MTWGGYLGLLAAQIGLILYAQVVMVLAPLLFLFARHVLHAPLLRTDCLAGAAGPVRKLPGGLSALQLCC